MIIPLTRHISMIDAPNRAKYPYCNCLYINDEINALIDNCCGKENLDYLLHQNINVVINSHFHEDHVANNTFFPLAEIWAHRLDAPAIRSIEVFKDCYGKGDSRYNELVVNFLTSANFKGSDVHRELQNDELLDFGSTQLRVIHTPGHTPGHCCFYEEASGMLFSSDIDLSGFGPWYGHKCSNLDDYISSIRKCMDIKPNLVVSSHNGVFRENIENSFLRYLQVIFRREEKVLYYLRKPSTLDELVEKRIFYGDTIDILKMKENEAIFYNMAEKMAIQKHLDRLLRLNEIRQNKDIYYKN